MTTSLSNVIRLKDQILALAEAFGFSSDVKIYTPEFIDNSMDTDTIDDELIILVSQKSEESTSYKNAIFLQSKLINLLKCQVTIINYNAVSVLDQYNYDQRSRSLSDSSLLQLFDKASNDEITFKTLDDEDIDMQNIILKQAEEVLKKNKSNQLIEIRSSTPSFFPTDNSSSNVKPEDISPTTYTPNV